MKKGYLLLILSILINSSVYAQAPAIYSVEQKSSSVNQIISIAGKNFGNNANGLKVFFGAAEGKVVSASGNLIKARVPGGATYGKISVTNVSTQLTGYSALPFYTSFDGNTFNATHLSNQIDVKEEDELFDLCTCDFDGDGLVDIGTTNNSNLAKFTSITLYKNNSTPTAISFQTVFGSEFNVNRETRNITCGDLNGDGKAELIVSQGGNAAERIYILKNISTGPGVFKFEGAQILSLGDGGPTNGARRIAIEDIDKDGKPEVIVSNQNVKQLVIFKNESQSGILRFPENAKFKIDVPGNTLGLTIQDLDGDLLPEIIAGNNLSDNLYFIKNNSFPGNIAFDKPVTLSVPGLLVNILAGDIDGDDRPDLVATDFSSGNMLVLLNQSVKNTISFSSPQKVLVAFKPWGLDMGDINGDGKLDLAVSSLAANDKNIILLNKSTEGSINFQSFRVGNKEITRNIKIADLNGDAKPDLCFTSQKSDTEFYLSTLQNSACVVPVISPATPDPVCAGVPITLKATQALQVTYQWKKDGVDIPAATEATLEVSNAGNYSVTVKSLYDGCSQTSTPVTVNEKTEAIPPTPSIVSSGNVCEGGQMQLSPSAPDASATYYWSGPNDFSYTGATLTIDNIDLTQSGEYLLQAGVAGCKSDTGSIAITVNKQPDYEIIAANSLSRCEGESTELMVANESDLQYQWYKNGVAIENETAYNFTATESGAYYVNINSLAGCSQTTSPVDVLVLDKPNTSFTAVSLLSCIDEEIIFTNTTTYNNAYAINYDWDFGNGMTSDLENPTQSYSTEGTFEVMLTTTYADYDCSSTFEQITEITDVPAVNILSSSDILCEGDSVLLTLDNSFVSVTWSDGSSNDSIYAFQEGTYEVTVTNDAGCINSTQLNISKELNPEVSVSANKSKVIAGDPVELLASGADNYLWSPADDLSNPSVDNPVATPIQPTVYTVIGTNMNGCIGTDSIKINVEQVVNITPKNMFSPNNDGIDDYWLVDNIENFPDCKISVFNLQGRRIYESQPYLNNWEGNDHQGKPLTEGVYYYTIQCNGRKKNEKTGSITLIR